MTKTDNKISLHRQLKRNQSSSVFVQKSTMDKSYFCLYCISFGVVFLPSSCTPFLTEDLKAIFRHAVFHWSYFPQKRSYERNISGCHTAARSSCCISSLSVHVTRVCLVYCQCIFLFMARIQSVTSPRLLFVFLLVLARIQSFWLFARD